LGESGMNLINSLNLVEKEDLPFIIDWDEHHSK
jgi:hypothetical protein